MTQVDMRSNSNQASKSVDSFPLVVIVVLNWNGKENTCECLNSIANLQYSNYEVVVVDNASTDGSPEFFRINFPQFTLIKNLKNLGFGEGLNVGIREAAKRNADYVLCLNNDVVVDRYLLNELVAVGELSAKIAGMCPLEYSYDQPDRIICAGGSVGFLRGKVSGHGEIDKGQFNKVTTTRLLSGPAMMFKLKAIYSVGLFEKKYFYGPEDQDIALRIIRQGYYLAFTPRAKLWHKRRGATSGKITPLNDYFHVRNYLLFARKNATTLEYCFALSYFGLVDFPLTFLMRLFSRKWDNLKAMIRGIIWHFNPRLLPTDCQMVNHYLCI